MLDPLCRFPGLRELNLQESKVTDDGLRHVASLANLERLDLYKSAVNGSGLMALTSLKSLKSVYLWRGQLSRDGREVVKEVAEALPNCEVVVSDL